MLAADPKIIYCHSDETREFRHELEVSSKHQNAPAVIWYFKTIIAENPGAPAPPAFRGGKDGKKGDVEMVYGRRQEREGRPV